MIRSFDVYTPRIVVYPGETFHWTVTDAESTGGVVITPVNQWPLNADSYKVSATAPAAATVQQGTAGQEVLFTCQPPAGNVMQQTMIVAQQCAGNPCNGAIVEPGGQLIWTNDTDDAIIVRPSPGNPEYWPLPDPEYAVPPQGWLVLDIPVDAVVNKSYGLVISTLGPEPKANACPGLRGEPVIIITPSSPTGPGSRTR